MSPEQEGPLPPIKQAVEAVEIQHEGKPMILLRDQEGLNSTPIAVSPPAFLITMLLNGQNSIADVQSTFSKNMGVVLKAEEIKSLIDQLNQADLLETPMLKQKRKKIMDDFHANPIRKAVHIQNGSTTNSLDFAATLGKFFRDSKGPQKEFSSHPSKKSPYGLISPHIDLDRGGPAYAWAYQALSECSPPDLIVALGVAHVSPNSPWIMTQKEYETPYGTMKVDKNLYDAVRGALWYDPRDDEWTHRMEHSLEFQAVWLKYLWRDKTPPWVPILCSSFERFSPDRALSHVGTIESAIVKIGESIKDLMNQGKRVMILAGVDLAHVGPRFGDNEKLGPELNSKTEKEDRDSLIEALALNADQFYASAIKDGHWRKVCGLSALYTSLRLIKIMGGDKPHPGQLLTYDQAPDPMGGLVSFASAIFQDGI